MLEKKYNHVEVEKINMKNGRVKDILSLIVKVIKHLIVL